MTNLLFLGIFSQKTLAKIIKEHGLYVQYLGEIVGKKFISLKNPKNAAMEQT